MGNLRQETIKVLVRKLLENDKLEDQVVGVTQMGIKYHESNYTLPIIYSHPAN